MARAFAGGVSTDSVKVTKYAAITDLDNFSMATWSYRTGAGGGPAGRYIDVAAGFTWQHEEVNGYSNLIMNRWTTSGTFHLPLTTLGTWAHQLFTYSYSAVGNTVELYQDGVESTITHSNVPTGPLETGLEGDFFVGNRLAGDRCWDGYHAEVAIWNRVLSAGEAATVYKWGVSRVQNGLVLYLPLTGVDSPEPNLASPANPGTVTGTTAALTPLISGPALIPQLGIF
jgi:hypothetical protein